MSFLEPRADNGVTAGVIKAPPVIYSIMASFTAVAWYNVFELNIKIFLTFKRRRGLYFWSLLLCSWGIAIHALAFILKFFVGSASWILNGILITIGWYAMVTGQSVVLYSRLHLVLRNPTLLRFILVMICLDIFLLHIPTTVFTFGSNSPSGSAWVPMFNVMERVQMTGFCCQEFFISCIYIWATLKLLKPIYHSRTRKIMTQLIAINVVIILMDIVLLVMEYKGYYEIEASLKSFVYSIKLKLEFAILNQLMILANSGLTEGAMSSPEPYHEPEKDNERSNSVATLDSANAAASARHPSEVGTHAFVRALAKGRSRHKWTKPSLRGHSTRNWILKTQDVEVSSELKRTSTFRLPKGAMDHSYNHPDFITAPAAILNDDKVSRKLPTDSANANLDRKKPIRSNRPSVEDFGPPRRAYSPTESEIELKSCAHRGDGPFPCSPSSSASSCANTISSPVYRCQTSLTIPTTAEEAHAAAVRRNSHSTQHPRHHSHGASRPVLNTRSSVEDFGAERDDIDPETGTIHDFDEEDDDDDDMLDVQTFEQAKRDIEGGRPPRHPDSFN
ncbi:MAG: hypothetical protein M4579_006748 [Chaenotheca gracillima]|nr:MAG: hypothetical protein M4579_006748 [Chaenotheca gracillima]